MRRIIILLLAVFLLTGCTQKGVEIPSKFEGTEALKMDFMEDAPAESYYEGDKLSIGLYLENMGTLDIEEGTIRIDGGENINVTIRADRPKPDFSLDGLRSFYGGGIKGLEVPLLFDAEVVKFKEREPDTKKTVLGVVACYKYQTIATGAVCLEKTEYRVSGEESRHACNAGEVDLGTQGAPVAVSKVETRKGSGTITVYVDIVSEEETQSIVGADFLMENCQISKEAPKFSRYDTVQPTVKIGDVTLKTCPKTVAIKEKDLLSESEKNMFECPFDKSVFSGDSEAVMRPIEITLDYGVLLYKTKEVTLKKKVSETFK